MRILKWLFIGVGCLVGVALAVIGAQFAYQSFDQEDAFFVRNAELADPDFLSALARRSEVQRRNERPEPVIVYAHRLKRGTGTIVGYRWYSNGKVMMLDDESYRKLTIWIPVLPSQDRYEINLGDNEKTIAIFGEGGSAWPRGGCAGYITSGVLYLEHQGSGFAVQVQGDVTPLIDTGFCKHKHVDMRFYARKLPFEELTPWLGLAGNHPYEETYR